MENTCPCCGRHCPIEDLHCDRGRAHFGGEGESHSFHGSHESRPEEKALVLLRKCGHFLHHSGDAGNPARLLSVLTEEERLQLEYLLEKCLNSWQK